MEVIQPLRLCNVAAAGEKRRPHRGGLTEKEITLLFPRTDSVLQGSDAPAHGVGLVPVRGRKHTGHALVRRQLLPDLLQKLRTQVRIQPRKGIVEKNQLRLRRHHSRHGRHQLLRSGELVRVAAAEAVQTVLLQKLRRLCCDKKPSLLSSLFPAALAFRMALRLTQHQTNVLFHRHFRKKRIVFQ